MSGKGSSRRPTDAQAYGANFDVVFGKKSQDPEKAYSMQEAISKWGTYPWKIWNQHEDGSITPHENAIGDTIVFRDKETYLRAMSFVEGRMTCGNCKHWELFPRIVSEVLGSNWDKRGVCNGELAEFIDGGGSGIDFAPPEDFGCNKWAEKV